MGGVTVVLVGVTVALVEVAVLLVGVTVALVEVAVVLVSSSSVMVIGALATSRHWASVLRCSKQ